MRSEMLFGPGVESIGSFEPKERRLFRTLAEKIGKGWVCFPGWNPEVAILVEIPFAKWNHGRAWVSINKCAGDCRKLVIAPPERTGELLS